MQDFFPDENGTPHFSPPHNPPHNPIDNRGEMAFPMPTLGMKTTFANQLKMPAPVNGSLAIWTRVSGHPGSVGRKF